MENEKSLMQRLLDAGYPLEEMDHHESNLYVYVTPLTTRIVEDWCKENGYDRTWHCPIFKDNITGKPMYDCVFQYDPFWEEKSKDNTDTQSQKPKRRDDLER